MAIFTREIWSLGRGAIAIGLVLLLTAFEVRADNVIGINDFYRGIHLKVVPANPAIKPDIPLIGSSEAMRKLKASIDLIYKLSPFNATALDLLKSEGEVVVIYDPAFPEWSLGNITLAAFLPDFFEPAADANGNPVFVAMLGRYIIKHTAAEIAAEGIVHELVGHGIQHMQGRLANGNSFDLECEASLYEMQAFQDLGVDLHTAYMVRFRQELEDLYCDHFKRFMRMHKAWLIPLWDESPLNVKRALAIFDEYSAQLPN